MADREAADFCIHEKVPTEPCEPTHKAPSCPWCIVRRQGAELARLNMSKCLKLYVWKDVLTDYTSGIMFALAESVGQAREIICPGWAETEARWRESPSDCRVGCLHTDLRDEPGVHETPVGFTCWGGG